MATSGSISRTDRWVTVTLSWNRTSVDVSKNTSTISYELSIYRQYNIGSSAAKKYSIVINGTTVASGTNTIGGSGTKVLKTGTTTIAHGSDGTKTFSYSFSQEISATLTNIWMGTLSNSGSGVLDPIARTSKHTLNVSSQALGSAIVITTNRASTAFTHTITYSFNGASGTISSSATTSVSWTLPASLASQIPNATSGSGSIKCVTYNGSTKIGEHSVNFTATVPNTSTYNPSIGGLTHVEAGGVTIGAYVQRQSKIKWTMTSISTKYSATVKSHKITFDGGTWTTSTATTGVLKGSGSLKAVATITDSRGRTATREVTVTVLAYNPPSITKLSVFRANSNGVKNEFGTHARIDRSATASSLLVGGTERNTLKYTIKTKERAVSTWTTKVGLTTNTGLSLTGGNTTSVFEVTKSYDVRVEVSDLFNTTIALDTISTGEVTLSWGRSGIGVGKVWENGALDVRGDTHVNGGIYIDGSTKGEGVPTGLGTLGITGASGKMVSMDYPKGTHGYMEWSENYDRTGYIGFPSNGSSHLALANIKGGGYIYLEGQNVNFRNETATYNGVPVFTSANHVLWTGAIYMQSGQSITPDLSITNCPTGWILVWSRYDAGAVNDNWSFNHIPRAWQVARTGNGGVQAIIGVEEGSYSKYLYITNTTISGHDRNRTPPHSGRVLRYVLAY